MVNVASLQNRTRHTDLKIQAPDRFRAGQMEVVINRRLCGAAGLVLEVEVLSRRAATINPRPVPHAPQRVRPVRDLALSTLVTLPPRHRSYRSTRTSVSTRTTGNGRGRRISQARRQPRELEMPTCLIQHPLDEEGKPVPVEVDWRVLPVDE